MQIVQYKSVEKHGLPKQSGSYLCRYKVRGVSDELYNVLEFNKDANEFQFGYVGVVVTHYMECPKVDIMAEVKERLAEVGHGEQV